MAAEIAGLPFWELTFDAQGDPDGGAARRVPRRGARPAGITDVIVFAHGWNNDRRIAMELYTRFFGLLAPQLPAGRPREGRAGGRVLAVAALVRRADPGLRRGRRRGRRRRCGRARRGGAGGCRRPIRRSTPATLAGLRRCSLRPRRRSTRWRPCCRARRTARRSRSSTGLLGEFSRLAARRQPGRRRGRQGGRSAETGEPRMLLDDPHRRSSSGTADALVANAA